MKRFSLLLFTIAFLALVTQVPGQHHSKGSLGTSGPRTGTGPLSSATVSFGAWMVNGTAPVDRFLPGPGQFPRFSNHHALVPEIAKIKAGGTVNFIIAGLHVVAIYDDGTTPADIDTTILVPNRPPMTPPIIDDADGRLYRGLDPLLLPVNAQQDRVEVVTFDEPGVYLVICAVLPHFAEGMYGYVRVLPSGDTPTVSKK